MSRRKFGYIPDEYDDRDFNLYSFKGIISEEVQLPDEFSLDKYGDSIFDQSNTSSCVANAVASALTMKISIDEVDELNLKILSRLYLYYNSRKMHSSLMRDTGTYIRTCIKTLKFFGVPEESHWKFSSSMFKINRRPPWKAYMMGYSRRNGEYYRIFDVNDRRIEAVKRSIYSLNPVVFGTDVSKSFLSASGPCIFDKPLILDPIVGSHAMLIVGYKTTDKGTLFRVRNSWGNNWGDNGRCWITDGYLTWIKTNDLWIINN